MINTVHGVDDGFFVRLCKIWEEETPAWSKCLTVIEEIHRKHGIDEAARRATESILLYGRSRDNQISETMIGYLFSVCPGIVVLDAQEPWPWLSGLLDRHDAGPALFGLRSFASLRQGVHLHIWPSAQIPGHGRKYEICPVWIDYNLGGSHFYGDYGIDPARWELMSQWLNQWLPANT